MASAKYNTRNPAVKRIMQEMKELQKDPSSDYMAAAIEDNIFEWHFAVRGPVDTEFQGGIYHGRILLPPEYPFKPPSFLMLSPNGRFETNTKICLSISSHHPEHWQPSWSVRTALTALVAFFPSPGNGAIGSLDFTNDERAELAVQSRAQAPVFGSPDRQAITDEVHAEMLKREPQGNAAAEASEHADAASPKQPSEAAERSEAPNSAEQASLAQEAAPVLGTQGKSPAGSSLAQPRKHAAQAPKQSPARDARVSEGRLPAAAAAAMPAQHSSEAHAHPQQAQTLLDEVNNAVQAIAMPTPVGSANSWEDTGLTMLAGVIVMLIAAILFRRILIISGTDVTSLM